VKDRCGEKTALLKDRYAARSKIAALQEAKSSMTLFYYDLQFLTDKC